MIYNSDQIKHTLSTILHAQGDTVAAEVLDWSRAEIAYVGHDFEMDLHCLNLRIPAVRFAQIDNTPKALERIQERIRDKLGKLGVDSDSTILNQVRVLPELVTGPGAASIALPSKTDENRIWKANRLRLFFSHRSRVKTEAAVLKRALCPLGIDAFLAHDDIEPYADWRRDVEFALRSMHGLCALITPDYKDSEWCDQEAGYALGRAVPVLSVGWGQSPYGLIGKQQAIKGNSTLPAGSAGSIFDVLAKQPHLVSVLTEGLVDALVNAPTITNAITSIQRIVAMEKNLTKEQILRMLDAANDNPQVRDATDVPEQIEGLAKKADVSIPIPTAKVAGEFDDDIPF